MEITNENKIKALSPYIGLMIVHNISAQDAPGLPLFGLRKDGYILVKNSDGELEYKDIKVHKIKLKPLSAITDQDANELAELKGNENPLYIIASFRGQPEYKKGPDQKVIKWFTDQTQFYQFLQSKGYDLPNFYLGGKTLFEAGLAHYNDSPIAVRIR